MLAIAILLLLTFVMSGRGVEDFPADGPAPKSPAEMVESVRRTGWLRGAAVTLWFVVVFVLHLIEAQGRSLVLLGAAAVVLLCWVNRGLANLAASREVATPA
jgi:hypothetical protein